MISTICKCIQALCILVILLAATKSSNAQPNHVVISQIYGGGGNSSAIFKNDYVELYNPTNATVTLTGWSLQYAGATSANWSSNKVDLVGSIAPGKYFLVQLGGGTAGNALPTPDQSSTAITMSATSGKVALVNSTTVLSVNCPSFTNIIDFVGFGSADCNEGAGKAVTASVSTALFRGKNGCTDTDNNLADFVAGVPSPRNSLSMAQVCSNNSITTGAVSGMPFCVTTIVGSTGSVQFTAIGTFVNSNFQVLLSDAIGSFAFASIIGSTTINGTNPSGSINITIPSNTPSGTKYKVRVSCVSSNTIGSDGADFEITNGAKNINTLTASPNNEEITMLWSNPTSCFDEIMLVAKQGASINALPVGDGSMYNADLNFNGHGSAFDGGKVVYKGAVSGQKITGLTNGTTYYIKAFSRRGTQWSTGIEASDKPRLMPLPGEILINQLSPDFNLVTDEYIELVNVTNKTFNLADLAIRYQAASGNPGVAGGSLSGTLQPYSFWLLSANSSITVGKTAGLIPDGSIADGFTANGQIALVRKTDNAMIDAVGYGTLTGGTFVETLAATVTPTDGGLKRVIDGKDNNNNASDFIKVNNADIDLRNSSSRLVTGNQIPTTDTLKRLYIVGNTSLQSSINVLEKVYLTGGQLSLGNYNLTITDIQGASSTNYIKTNGTGSLTIKGIGAASKLIPIGNSTYNPVTIGNGDGQNWTVRVQDDAGDLANSRNINRTWHITPSATAVAGATITFEYNDGDAAQTSASFNKNEEVQVWNYHNSKWQKAGALTTPTGTASSIRTVTITNWTQFSPFAVSNNSSVLPVKFYNVKAAQSGEKIKIEFTNLTETDIRCYEIQRSINGINFERVKEITTVNNDDGKATYVYTDNYAATCKLYYRIKAVEKNNVTVYSPVVSLMPTAPAPLLTILANPVINGNLHFNVDNLPAGPYTIKVFNNQGVAVYTASYVHKTGVLKHTVYITHARPGKYILELNGKVKLNKAFVIP